QEAMDEAICFGWIDTTVRRLDEERYVQNFAKRNKTSKWSDNTRSYARRLIKEGLMTPAGLHAYKDGLTRPTHHEGIPNNPNTPEDLKAALSKNKTVYAYFKTMAPSTRKTYLRWMLHAKLPETRKKRIMLIVNACKEKKNIFKSKAE
ncbi:MAG TPA: YdeI/OmpD-associated family protein, partial [Candidatus Nanoarchaeia archaeon]|nr:YdeI/OmpD-associated family protein [Candidatus Nanoarchaeia archaeon]